MQPSCCVKGARFQAFIVSDRITLYILSGRARLALHVASSCWHMSLTIVGIDGMAMQVDFLLSRLKVLYERIDDTEDLINIELDHRFSLALA